MGKYSLLIMLAIIAVAALLLHIVSDDPSPKLIISNGFGESVVVEFALQYDGESNDIIRIELAPGRQEGFWYPDIPAKGDRKASVFPNDYQVTSTITGSNRLFTSTYSDLLSENPGRGTPTLIVEEQGMKLVWEESPQE